MIVEVAPDRFPNMYEIVPTVSTLVLTAEKNKEIHVTFGKWKSSQLFFLQRHNPKFNPNEFYLKSSKDSKQYLYCT